MRGLLLGCLALLPYAAVPAFAQEPLFLRILPNDVRPNDGGSAPLSDDEIAAQARAAREAVWQRADRRARLAIASVCTGCLEKGASATERPISPAAPTATAARSAANLDDAAVETAGASSLSLADSR